MKESDYYVGIENHQLIRRDLLESTKGVIKILQRIELIKHKREEKIEKIMELKKLVEEINFLISNLKKELPKADKTHGIKTESRSPEPIKKVQRKSKKKTEPKISKTKKNDNLDDLENELNDIESKLNNLK